MARDPVTAPWRAGAWAWHRPWPIMLAGLALTLAGVGLGRWIQDPPEPTQAEQVSSGIPVTGGMVAPKSDPQVKPYSEEDDKSLQGEWLNPYRFLLLAGGVILAGVAVQRRLTDAPGNFDARLESAALLASAAVVLLIAYLGMARDWDSAHIVLIGLLIITLAGSVLLLLPRPVMVGVVSVWLLYHFSGIFVACTNQDPSNTSPPWLSNKAWEYGYRHYLGVLYLNNAYHFYSPDPGPADLLWFRIEYANGEVREVRMPERGNSPVPLHYTRLIAMGNSIMMSVPYGQQPEEVLQPIRENRVRAGDNRGIPLHPYATLPVQYQEPTDLTKVYIASYARHIVHEYPHPSDNPAVVVKSVRIYHVIHDLMVPYDLVTGHKPTEPPLYRIYYLGEFKPDGSFTNPNEPDPFLYWLLPVYRDRSTGELFNGYEIHCKKKADRPDLMELDN